YAILDGWYGSPHCETLVPCKERCQDAEEVLNFYCAHQDRGSRTRAPRWDVGRGVSRRGLRGTVVKTVESTGLVGLVWSRWRGAAEVVFMRLCEEVPIGAQCQGKD